MHNEKSHVGGASDAQAAIELGLHRAQRSRTIEIALRRGVRRHRVELGQERSRRNCRRRRRSRVYLAANPDAAAAGVDPLSHYLNFGIYEGRPVVNDGVWH